jgi:eukaryotic-like serine/threonine-protein kinase
LSLEHDVSTGQTLGRYELLIPIARGGMASVWAARIKGVHGFQKIVAVKTMLPEFDEDPDFEKMFLDEARTAARIRHPNVAEILDLGEEDGVLYLIMEWVDGEPLHLISREKQARFGIPVSLAVRIGADAATGLHSAHELRDGEGRLIEVVHRDVTPANILVTYDGVVKVVDFGVAKSSANAQMTRVGQTKGKIPYMSPEQARGEPVDRRTDIFALGIILHQLCTGRHPFRGENDMATLRAIVDRNPIPAPRQYRSDLPETVELILMRALAKDPRERFATMAEMAMALEESMPVARRASPADLGEFMRALLGPRGDKRRAAIRQAARIADERLAAPPASGREGAVPVSGRDAAGPTSGRDAAGPTSGRDAAGPTSGWDPTVPSSGPDVNPPFLEHEAPSVWESAPMGGFEAAGPITIRDPAEPSVWEANPPVPAWEAPPAAQGGWDQPTPPSNRGVQAGMAGWDAPTPLSGRDPAAMAGWDANTPMSGRDPATIPIGRGGTLIMTAPAYARPAPAAPQAGAMAAEPPPVVQPPAAHAWSAQRPEPLAEEPWSEQDRESPTTAWSPPAAPPPRPPAAQAPYATPAPPAPPDARSFEDLMVPPARGDNRSAIGALIAVGVIVALVILLFASR